MRRPRQLNLNAAWESDGTAAGTVFVADVPFEWPYNELNLAASGPYVGFTAYHPEFGMEPHMAIVYPDRDDDGDWLTRREELRYGTDPFVADTDGDGVHDGLEVALGRDPLVPEPAENVPLSAWPFLAALPVFGWAAWRRSKRQKPQV